MSLGTCVRTLNKRFMRHDRATDVLSFRYNGSPEHAPRGRQVAGDILIAPRLAHSYARRHRIPYVQELSRYVVHGLLHWLGHEDRTAAEQRAMRRKEDRLLIACKGVS